MALVDRSLNEPGDLVAGEAFEVVYARLRDPMRRLAFVLVGDLDVADDLVQDAFTRLYRHRRKVERVDAYLRSAVINACRNHHRSTAVRRRPVAPVASATAEPDDLRDAIERLPYRQRAVVVLRFYEGLSGRETADVLRLPEGTVKSTLHRALAELRRRTAGE